MKTLFKIFFLFLLAAALWVGFNLFAPVNVSGERYVLLTPGSSTRQIAHQLKAEGIIRDANTFLAWNMIDKRSLKAGEYRFAGSTDLRLAHDKIARGEVSTHQVVIPEGYNIFDIAKALDDADICTQDEFLNVAKTNLALIEDIAPEARTLEGYLFPDTYAFNRTDSAQQVAARMVKRFRKEAAAIGLTSNFHRTVTMASIVEKETGLPRERPLVAGVFENRLRNRMGLATDPSVIYAALIAGRYDGVIHQSDLQYDSPYNTYKYAGLPPGPIANPGRESLLAALKPLPTEFLYFVANNQGGHNFARTIEEHNRNVMLYRQGR